MSKKQQRRVVEKDTEVASKSFDSTDVDWRDSKTAGQCLSHLYLSDHLSDVTFTFKNHRNVQVPAHKFVLSMRSSVFEAMFYGPMAEVGQTVTIGDIEPDTMKVLLRFMYSDIPRLDGNNVLRCLYAAKKYALTGLVKQCSAFLENNIDSSNVCAIHDQAVFYDMKSLETKCFEFILENAPEALASQDFLKVSHATLIKLLKHDELAEDEVNVFDAAMRWARNDCKARNVTPDSQQMRKSLGEALFAIRFPIMAIEEFAKVVTPVGILTSEEQIMLYQYNATKGSTALNKFQVRERSGKEVKIEVSGSLRNSMGQYCGYHLQINVQEHLNYGIPNVEKLAESFPRIKSVSGTFVKKVKSISLQNTGSLSSYTIKENKIIFRNPVKITNGSVNLSFHTSEDAAFSPTWQNSSGAMSSHTQINEKVDGRSICISQIPVGMDTISFAIK